MAKPKLALIPCTQGYFLNSVLPSDGSGDFRFGRSGTATRINSQGLIEEVDDEVSRLNYPMIDGKVVGCPSHLLEPQRSNLITYSEDFNDASWLKTNLNITKDVEIAPNGLLNASKILQTVSGGYARINTTFSGSETFSLFVKKGDLSDFKLFLGGNSVYFDLQNGVVLSENGTSLVGSKIENFKNGWYRCSLISNYSGSSSIRFQGTNGTDDGSLGYVYTYGAQLEQGSYPTSYIPTSGSAVTRSAETANGAGDATTFNDSEGVLMAEISALADDGTFRVISINGTATNVNTDRIQIYFRDTVDIITFGMESGNSSQFFLQFPLNVKLNNKLALKYSASSCSFWINGIKVGEQLNKVMPTGLLRLDFVRQDGNDEFFYGNTKQLQYYNTVLTDSELEQLTSWTSFTDMANGQLYTIE